MRAPTFCRRLRDAPQTCRLSKVKCDIEHQPSGVCGRCQRLGQQCTQPQPGKRGRPARGPADGAQRAPPSEAGEAAQPAAHSLKQLLTEPVHALASALDKISVAP